MVKQFSSPRRFASFQVVNLNGEVAFQGGPPVREIPTDALGALRTVWVGDFTQLRTPGRYRIVTDDGLTSYPFNIGPGVFDAAVRAVQRAFYYQRAFTEIEAKYAQGPWVHASDAALAPPGVVRGWHDAGDFSIYSASTNSALFWLLSAVADFSPRKTTRASRRLGMVCPICWTKLDGGWSGCCRSRVRMAASGIQPARSATGRMAPICRSACRPIAPARWAPSPPAAPSGRSPSPPYCTVRTTSSFAERSLEAALAGYRFLRDRPAENSDGPTCPAMRQDGDPSVGRDVRMYAAAGLLLATGDQRFGADFLENYQPIQNDPSYLRSNVYAALLYLRASAGDPERQQAIREDLRRRAEEVRLDGEGHPFQWAGRTFWGSIAAGFQRTAGFSAQVCLEDPVAAAAHCEQVLANVHHALGRNYQQIAYVSGLPGVTRGRTHGFHHWLATLDAKPFLFPGLVAGGPNAAPEPADISVPHGYPRPAWGYWGDPAMPRNVSTPVEGRYTDNDSWSTNELDIDWQGVTLYNFYFARQWASRPPSAK